MVLEEKKIQNATDWNRIVISFPSHHILQSWQWGEIKQRFGWQMEPTAWCDRDGNVQAAAMLLVRSLKMSRFDSHLRMIYSPRGPLVNWDDNATCEQVLDTLETIARKQHLISLKIDPELILGWGVPGEIGSYENEKANAIQRQLRERGWQYSPSQVQFRNTVWLNLTPSEEELLAVMKQKTRYNIRLAERKGVVVREGGREDLPALYRMYSETSLRDGFVIRSEAYYLSLWERFLKEDLGRILLAEVEGEIVAGLVLFHFGGKAWYFYGMANQQHREKMPSYLVQWEAIKLAKKMGCHTYDFWGAPEVFDKTDGMWGVYRFKEGFSGKVIRTLGAWDFAPHKGLYSLFTHILPELMRLMRSRRMAEVRHEMQE